ncbi:MAG: hypothetical protein ACM36B_03610 [Bacteroidota bacterium]|jgi:hypothetical protein
MFPEWWRMMNGAAQMWLAVPQVIAMRGARIAAGGLAPGADDRRELARMVTEKTAAAGESAVAVTAQLWRIGWDLSLAPMRWWWATWTHAATRARLASPAVTSARIVDGALAPVRRRVTANAKRLRRRKRR